jgi:hypothetical protein
MAGSIAILRAVSARLKREGYLIPNMPGMDGIPGRPPPDIFFIIFCISRN